MMPFKCSQMWSEEADTQRADLAQRLAATTSTLEELRASSAEAAAQAAARHEEEASMLRQKLEQAQSESQARVASTTVHVACRSKLRTGGASARQGTTCEQAQAAHVPSPLLHLQAKWQL